MEAAQLRLFAVPRARPCSVLFGVFRRPGASGSESDENSHAHAACAQARRPPAPQGFRARRSQPRWGPRRGAGFLPVPGPLRGSTRAGGPDGVTVRARQRGLGGPFIPRGPLSSPVQGGSPRVPPGFPRDTSPMARVHFLKRMAVGAFAEQHVASHSCAWPWKGRAPAWPCVH